MTRHGGQTVRLEDATDRQRVATRHERTQALLVGQSQILELAVRDEPLPKTLDELIRIVEALSSTTMLGSILLFDKENGLLRHGAAPHLPPAYNKAIDGVAVGPNVGSCGTAVHRGDAVFVEDIASDPLWADFRELALSHDLRACWSVPIATPGGKILGTFAMYHREPRRPDSADLELVDFVVRSAALLIERKGAVNRLRESEARFRNMADHAPVMMWVTDATGYCTYLNRSWYEFTGQDPHVGEAYGWLDAVHPDDRPTAEAAFVSANAEQRQYRVDFRLRRADGVYRWTIDAAAPRFDQDGRYLGYVGSVIDIDERREAEERLRVSEERLRLATENAEIGFWDVDVIDDVLIWPPRVKAMFGISANAPVAMQDFYQGLHPDDRDATGQAFAAACDARARALYDVEYRTIGKEDGLVRWVAAKGRGIFDAEGRCLRVIGTAIDVTERKRDEEKLLESEARLRFLRTLDDALQNAADAPAAMMVAAELLAVRLGASRCAYADVDSDSDRFIIRDDYVAPGVQSSAGTYNLDLFGSRAVADMRGGTTLVVRDVGAELAPDDGRDMFQSIGINAIVCCPLVKDDRLVAMMAVHQDRPRHWRADEVGLVQVVVDRCWAHVQRIGAEARLRESEERYRTLFEAVDAGFTIAEVKFDDAGKAIDYRLLEMNPAFERQTGMTGLGGISIRQAIPDLEEHWFEAYGRVAATGEPARFESYAEPLGRWFDVHAFRIGSPYQKLVAILFNDITDRKCAEDALRAMNDTLEAQVAERTAELRFNRDIIEATTSPICAFDTEYRLIAFNKAHNDEFRRVNGFDTKIGDLFPDLFTPEQAVTMRALMSRALSGERFTVSEAFGRPEYGQPCWEISYTPLCDAEGRIVGAFHLAEDISERLRAEAELATAQEALRQSQKMEAMGSLTGGVAHDFNNLLTPIVGSLDLLQRKGLGGEREQRLVAGALQSAERAKTLVQRLLAFARRQPLQPRPVDVSALVTGMADLVASTSGPQTRVSVDVEADLPAAVADPNQLEMAILNLSVNARDAMPDGGRLSISARVAEISEGHHTGLKPGRFVRLSVADTGMGMDPETLKRAIEPFYSTKGIGKGTGLGLSMVHGLAAQLGGALTIESRQGLGTDVQLWLPTTEERASDPAHAEDLPSTTSAGVALVVDDEDIVRASTAEMLSELGYGVVEAASAEQALQLLAEGQKIDLLVTDHLMPGKTGTDLAREVLHRLPGTRTLIVSGYADAEGIAIDLPRLVKPFRLADLAASIAELVEPR